MSNSPTAPAPLRLAILGGGISGLTAAYRLTQLLPQAQIELYEATDHLGGVLQTRHENGLLIEQGADSFFNKLPAAVDLCHELGLADQIIPTNAHPRRALIAHAGKLHPVPTGFVQMRPEQYAPMLRSPLLSWRGKLRLLAERWQPTHPDIQNPDYDESVASFATRRLGLEVFQRLVQPLLAGIYTADPYKLSLAATMPTAIEAERQHGSLFQAVLAARKNVASTTKASSDSGARYTSFVTLRQGLGHLIKTLASRLPPNAIHLNSPAEKVTPTDNQRWTVSLTGIEKPQPYDGVILALPAPRAAQLLATTDTPLSDSLKSIPYASSAVAVLAYSRKQIADPLDGFGMVVPTVEGRQIIAASYSSIKFPGRAPDDQVLFRVFVGGALQPELLEKSDADILHLAQQELSDLLDIHGEPLRAGLVRWQQKMPQYHVGHVQLVDQIESLTAQHPGLELAGSAYRGVGIPQCVQSGDSAAQRLVETLARST